MVSIRGVRHDFEHDRLDVKHSYHVRIDGQGTVLENGEFCVFNPSDKTPRLMSRDEGLPRQHKSGIRKLIQDARLILRMN